jgi:insertion element IS1 protein InsB
VNEPLIKQLQSTSVTVVLRMEAAELDKMWSFVGSKKYQRWLWHTIDHQPGQILAYVLNELTKKAINPFGNCD